MPPIPPTQTPLTNITITVEGVKKLLLSLDPTKAPGPDSLSPRVLKEIAVELAPALTLLYQTSLNTGIVPSDWRTANVSPVFKKGERYKPENYRPISLTSILCKQMEHIMVSNIMTYCENNSILCHQQHGFRRGHSCETQLLGFVDEVSKNLESGAQEDLLVLDFSKAFDKVSHSLLTHKLHQYGISGNINKWIKAFLSDRKQTVVVNGASSEYVSVESGVPQGSVLGPTLFLLYINDLPDGLTSTPRLFADDTACHKKVKNSNDQSSLQNDLDKLADWEKRWKMSFHPQKCSVVHMTRRLNSDIYPYHLHGHELGKEENVKYLGLTINRRLDWTPHIDNIVAKANRTLGFIRRNIKIPNQSLKQAAYRALVRPVLEYASPVWDPFTKENIQNIERVQRRASRWVCHRYRKTSSVEEMLEGLKWPSLSKRRKRARLSSFFKFHNGLTSITSKYLPTPSNRRRSNRRFNSQSYDINHSRTDYRQKSFFPRTIPEWNELPDSTVSAPSLASFQTRLAASL